MAEVMDLGFEMQQSAEGRDIEFQVRGAGLGGGAIFAFVFFALMFAIMSGAFTQFSDDGDAGDFWTAAGIVFSLGVGIIVWVGKARSQLYSFKVTPTAVELNGKNYAKSDISEVFVRNAQGKSATQATMTGGTVVIGSGIAGTVAVGAMALSNAASSIGSGVGELGRESLEKRSNALCIRYGRKVIPLAENLEMDVAISLFNKVTEVI